MNRNVLILLGLATAGSGLYYYSSTTSHPNSLSPTTFTPLRIADITRVSADSAIFKFVIPAGMKVDAQALGGLRQDEAIASVWLKQPDLQIQRAYTVSTLSWSEACNKRYHTTCSDPSRPRKLINPPLPSQPLDATPFFPSPSLAGSPQTLDLLVKRYADGELSRWLHRLNVGDSVGVRGAVLTWATPEVCDEVVFVSRRLWSSCQRLQVFAVRKLTRASVQIVGGTGITPALQFLKSTLAAPSTSPPPKITVIYSSPSPSSILLKEQLDCLAIRHPDRLNLRYLVDREDTPAPPAKAGWRLWGSPAAKGLQAREDGVLIGRAGVEDLEAWIGMGTGAEKAGQRRVVVVCGPEG